MRTKTIAYLLAGATLACTSLAQAAPPASPSSTDAAFAKPQLRVDIGGRKINLNCSGAGALTVVFDAPSGEAGWNWHKVRPEVARYARACTYDRAGFGYSDPSPRPNTSENAAEDLHQALKAAGIKPPYVLVGNSLGGANVQVFAYRYPEEVAGMVLVEPQTEDLSARLDRASEGKLGQANAMIDRVEQYCLEQAEKGFNAASKGGSQALADCVGDPLRYYGPVLGKQVLASEMKKTYWRARVAEYNAIPTSDQQLRALRKHFGDMPVMVLTRGVSPYAVPGMPQSAVNKAMEDENEKIHKELAARSGMGGQRVVPGASHLIQEDKPAAVVEAVMQVLAQIE